MENMGCVLEGFIGMNMSMMEMLSIKYKTK